MNKYRLILEEKRNLGWIDIEAPTRKEAEEKFYQNLDEGSIDINNIMEERQGIDIISVFSNII